MPDTVKMDVREFISLTAKKFGVPTTFYSAIFGIESGWNPGIHDSPKGAMGIGQLMPATARGLGVNPRDPAQNIYGSLKLQRKLLDKYRKITGDEDKAWILAAAAYNAGEGAVEKHGGVPPYKETQNYVRHLIKEMKKARKGGVRPTGQQAPTPTPATGEGVSFSTPQLPAFLSSNRPAKEKALIKTVPKAGPPPTTVPQTSTAQPSHGLTPPPTRGGVRGFIEGVAKGPIPGPLDVFSEDTRRAFFQGVVGAGGSLAADFGYLATHPLGSPAGYVASKVLQKFGAPKVHPAQTYGEKVEQAVAQDIQETRSSTTLGRVRQGLARGGGMSMVELPKLIVGGVALKAATLPTFGAVSGARTGGPEGAVKGAALGAVYHYGGQVTGQFLGKVGNNLFWVAAPAAEQHFVQGKPLDEAIAEQVPMGVFAGSGGNRANVILPNGKLRPARVTDIPRIASGKLKLAEPKQQVMWDVAQRARTRFQQLVAQEGGFAKLREGGEGGGKLTRLPKTILPDLATLGAFHYEAGTRTPEDWTARMLGELKETPESISPTVAKQLGEVFERSKALYNEGTAPTFVSGLRQTIKELYHQKLIGDKIHPDRLINLIKSRGQGEELKDSGLEDLLLDAKKKKGGEALTVADLFNYLETRGMTMDVMRGGESTKAGFSKRLEEEEGGYNVLPQLGTRSQYLTPGGHRYYEGVVYSNKALEMSIDDTHFGFRPDQISWYRGQLMGDVAKGVSKLQYEARQDATGFMVWDNWGEHFAEMAHSMYDARRKAALKNAEEGRPPIPEVAMLEEIQSRRNSKARDFGVTKDPGNAHSRLVALEREMEVANAEAALIEYELGVNRWEPIDEYSRYRPDEDFREDAGIAWAKEGSGSKEEYSKLRELDKLRLKISLLEHEIQNLEHYTDSQAPAPWAPHLDTWYEPALKGFLREAAERLEPDQQGNIYATWTPASAQLERYPAARKVLQMVRWADTYWKAGNESDSTRMWDVTVYTKDDRATTYRGQSKEALQKRFGDEIADRIVEDRPTYVHDNGERELTVTKPLAIGGEWAVRLYGDTKENIASLYPNKPELQDFAWREGGNKAIVPAWLEKYGKAWGGRIEVRENQPRLASTSLEDLRETLTTGRRQSPTETSIRLVVPEEMRQAILKQGQLYYGRKLADLPRGVGYGLRNRVTPEESAQAARELIARKHKTVGNLLTGQRVPDPSGPEKGGGEGGFLTMGSRKPTLDPNVQTDYDTRGRDTAGVGVFFRSPSRWMRGFKDSRIDWVADRMFDAEVREHDYTTEWGRRFSAIIDSLNAATFASGGPRKIFGRKADEAAQQKTFSDFIDLIEMDFEVDGPPLVTPKGTITPKIPNPARKSSNPMIQRALEEHDRLAVDFKDYLIQSYADRGIVINDPANWGISEKGYFRHLFPGEDNVFMDGDYQGTAQTYVDAIKMANDLITANPGKKVEIKRRPIQFVDPSVRVSTRSFERLVRETLGTLHADGYVHVSAGEVRADYIGVVGKKENIGKFFAAALKREGYQGYLRDYEQVMRAHYFQLARSQELSKLRKDITPTLEELRREGLRGVVEGIERHIDDLWGRPLAYEKAVGGFIRKFPALRERIANPDLGLEIMVRKIASMHNILKLRFNPKAMFVNKIQPLRTLWPYLTNKDMWEVIKRYHNPKWRQDMTELGVMSGAVKLETGGSRVEGFGAGEFIKDPFTYVSGTNRALGYTAGIIFAERTGLTGYDAHKLGMKWAAKVEFDNSKWDAPRFLRHSAGQLFGQYKGFLVKDIENTIDIFSRQQTDSPTHPGLSKASRVGKWFLGTAAFGGLRAATSPIPWLGTAAGYSMYLGAAALIKATTDTSDKDAKFYASMLFLGSPSAAGVDLSASLTPIDDPPGLTAWEKVGRFALGPTPSSVYDIGRAGRQLVTPGPNEERSLDERGFNFATKFTPYARMLQRGYQLEQNVVHGKTQYLTIDRHRVPLTRTQLAFGAFGVPPANQTLYYEEKEATGKSPLSRKRGSSPFGNPTRGVLKPPVFKDLPKRN